MGRGRWKGGNRKGEMGRGNGDGGNGEGQQEGGDGEVAKGEGEKKGQEEGGISQTDMKCLGGHMESLDGTWLQFF